MNYTCYADKCSSNPIGYCLCTRVPIIFCLIHSLEHNQINRDHRVFDFVASPPSDSMKKIIKINQLKIGLKNTKKSVVSQSIELIKLVNDSNQASQNCINTLINKCNETLRLALQDENAEVIKNYSIMPKLASDLTKTNLEEWDDQLNKNLSNLQYLIQETLDISSFNLYENEIIFFTHGTKLLNTFNLDSHETQNKELSVLPEEIDSFISICELPNKSKFCYGNDSGLTFIIDQYKNIKLLPNGKTNWALDSKYYKNFVYAIGGYKNLAEKYNLLENKWESCASIPQKFNFNSSRSALIGGRIIIVGIYFENKIIYDIEENDYCIMSGVNLDENVHKFIFTFGNRVYIGVYGENFYESGENDLASWTRLSKTNPVNSNYYQISYYSLTKDSVFFLNYPGNLYEFKLKTKEINLVKEL